MTKKIDPYCISCHGTGKVCEESDGYVMFMECHCVEYHYTERQRELIAKVVAQLPTTIAGTP